MARKPQVNVRVPHGPRVTLVARRAASRLVADRNASVGQQRLDVPQAERDPFVERDSMTDHPKVYRPATSSARRWRHLAARLTAALQPHGPTPTRNSSLLRSER